MQEWQVNLKDVLNNEARKLQADMDYTKKSIDNTRTSIDEWLDSFRGTCAKMHNDIMLRRSFFPVLCVWALGTPWCTPGHTSNINA